MSRIIINNRSSHSDKMVVNSVAWIINAGRVSEKGKAYCYVTTFDAGRLAISAKRNKESDTFTAYDYPQKQGN